MSVQKTLEVEVRSPDKLIFAGKAVAVSSVNATGKFDILPSHANFISIIREYINIRQGYRNQKKLQIEQAVLHCKENTVKIFIGAESLKKRKV